MRISLPRRRNDEEEFPAHKGVVLCKDCGAAYFKKRWYHGLEKINLPEKNPSSAKASAGKDLPVKFGICPACTMIKNKQYEGRITIKNLPEKYGEKLEKLAKGFGERAYDRDPMHRVIAFEKDGKNWVIITTENELANKLAHKIKTTFNAKSKTHFAPEPSDVAEITIEF